MTGPPAPGGPPRAGPASGGDPSTMKIVPVRHPWRWVASAVIVLLIAMLVNTLLFSHVTRGGVREGRFQWGVVGHYLFAPSVLRGIRVTLELTVIAMVAGVIIGIVLAVMRLSPNRLLSATAWVYIWFFRGTPVLVQLVFWYVGISYLYQHIAIGASVALPFVTVHLPFWQSLTTLNSNTLVTSFVAGALGLSLNEGAYMSEIVRAGIISVDEGQTEAAASLGMSKGLTLRRIVLPQAMRVIIPPTGNETISMLKTTSLVSVIAVVDLFQATQNISNTNYEVVPLLMVASLWYLFFTSVMTIGQFYVERYYARGSTRSLPPTPLQRLRAGPRPHGGCARSPRSPRSPGWPRMTDARPWPPSTGSVGCAMRCPWSRPVAVHKSYGRLEVLKGIDLTVRRGEVLCLIGPVRVGEEHVPALHQPPGEDRRRRAVVDGELVGYRQIGQPALRAEGPGGVRQAGRDRHGLPALQPLPPHVRAGQRHLRAGVGQAKASGGPPRTGPASCSTGSGLADKVDATRTSSPAVSSSGWPSPGRWPWTRS